MQDWVIWLILSLVILVVVAVIVLFVTKAWKKNLPNNVGPQGSQGVSGARGAEGRQGTIGYQGNDGGPGVLLSQLPIPLQLFSIFNIKFLNGETTHTFGGVITVVEKMMTLQVSQINVVMTTQLTSDFTFDLVLPPGFQLANINPVQLFEGKCATNRQSGVNSTPIYLSSVTLLSNGLGLRFVYTSQDGLIWNGATGSPTTPLLTCDFAVSLLLA